MNKLSLKAKMTEQGTSVLDLSRLLGISQSTFYRKLNSDNNFTVGEASKIATHLHMNSDELTKIFLTD